MEAKQNNKKDDGAILILLLFVLLVGGGVGAYFLLKPAEELDEDEEKVSDGSIEGNKDYYLSQDEMIDPMISDPTKSQLFNPNSEGKELYLYGSEAQQLLQEYAKRLAQSPEVVGKLREQHNIGQPFLNNYSAEATKAIDDMFTEGFENVISRTPHTYPIFSTWETNNKGKQIRDELYDLARVPKDRLGLSPYRWSGEPWYIHALDLNLFYGKRNEKTHSAAQINSYKASRSGLDRYKKITGLDFNDRLLTKHHLNGEERYPAGAVKKIAEDWINEIDRLDEALKTEAQERLSAEGWKFTLIQNQA